METKKIGSKLFVRVETGEELMATLKKACEENGIKSGFISGIGGSDDLEIACFSLEKKMYVPKKFTGNYEVTSLVGDISTLDSEIYLHVHITIGDSDYKIHGGHLISAVISLTAEVVVDIADAEFKRELNEKLGINLLRF